MSIPLSPRVNYQLLRQHVGSLVRLVVKVLQFDPIQGLATVETSDSQTVHVRMNPENHNFYTTQYVEILGTVNPDLSINEQSVIPFTSQNFSETIFFLFFVSTFLIFF